MNLQLFKNRNGMFIIACIILIILIYSVDVVKLAYKVTAWHSFGEMPIKASTVQYFIPDTPNVIGYQDQSGLRVTCATTVAYVQDNAGDTYRCCNTGAGISCLSGNFSTDIPVMDAACIHDLQTTFAIPTFLEGTTDYQVYGGCSESLASELTIAQIDANGQIMWKSFNAGNIIILSSILRCIVVPLLLILVFVLVVVTLRSAPREPIPRF